MIAMLLIKYVERKKWGFILFYCKKLLVLFSVFMGRFLFVIAPLSFISALILTTGLFTQQAMAQEMAKCQDEQGNWHYGDFAAAECANNAEITNMSETGTVIGTVRCATDQRRISGPKKTKARGSGNGQGKEKAARI